MKRSVVILLAALLALSVFAGCGKKSALDPKDPVTLTMWHVYGSQTKSPLNDVINEFNRTVGQEKGITINVESVTSSSAIDKALAATRFALPRKELPR